MKILSLNCNKFGGRLSNGNGEHCSSHRMHEIVSIIRFFLETKEDALVVLQEVNYRPEHFKHFIEYFPKHEFEVFMPSLIDKKYAYGCTLAISKKYIFEQKDSLQLTDTFDYVNKSVLLKSEKYTILGIHMPYSEEYFDLLRSFYNKNKDERLIIIGDLNTDDEGTYRKETYMRILEEGAIDAWQHFRTDFYKRATCTTGRRTDYALLSPSASDEVIKCDIIDMFRQLGLTDHSGIYLEMEN